MTRLALDGLGLHPGMRTLAARPWRNRHRAAVVCTPRGVTVRTKFAYEDLSPEQFEFLVVLICQRLLGTAVQGFASGPDGGRDARFEGVADLLPSTASPWCGRTIIQAKHTNGLNKHFGEADFYSREGKTTVLAGELPRIKRLVMSGELDNYLLFANRRLTGDFESEIRNAIADECGILTSSVMLVGVEQLDLWLRRFREVVDEADLSPADSPLIVSPDDLAEVVMAFAKNRETIDTVLDDPPTSRVRFEDKNRINNMTADYARTQLRKYLKDTAEIRHFLASPDNGDLLELYEVTVDEFQLKIVAHRRGYQEFDLLMEYLADLLFARDPILRQRRHRRLTRALLFYMYWNCDIGETEDHASPDEALAP